ncbi:uncharacterized protein LOC119667375 [Teleopsis dalmanni]|uniref:uncharacterized protein LOC119667375 n=1 Tax=Teleopsis dalmanni TaxID=139649 RepID=UPI0018CD2877|nr:uncharacterized protein LOC119667375 [Teleopsis dalmanni]
MAIALDPMSSEMVGKLGNKVFYGLSSAVLRPRHKGNRAKEVVEDERPTTSAACAQSSNQKPKTGLNSGGPPLRGGRIRAQGRKPSALSGRLRKWERKDPEAAELLRELIQRDLVAVQAEVPSTRGTRIIVFASMYLPGDAEEAVSLELQQLTEYCRIRNLQWVMCCDANAHHTVWGSTDINTRGESLFDYITTNNLMVVNKGNEPTFVNAIREEVLDLTLASTFISNNISNWRVLEENSLSDHKYIRFDLEGEVEDTFEIRNVRKTNWSLYNFYLEQNISCLGNRITNCQELNLEVNKLENIITGAFENSCELIKKKRSRNVPWWNRELDILRKKARQLLNRAKSNGDWASYKCALTAYNRELRKSKRESWRRHCEEIETLPAAARLQKSLNKDHSNSLSTLKKADGSFTVSLEETGQLLLDTHFPGCAMYTETTETIEDTRFLLVTRRDLSLARKIFTVNKTKWAISTFSPFKSPGIDNIQPCLLQKGVDILAPILTNLFRISLELGVIPKHWTKARVAFIPKAGKKADHTPKAFRPISLTSFLLKTMEKILDQYIREVYIKASPLHIEQYAYQSGKSTDTAIHSLTSKIEKALDGKEIALCTSVDITGAFDNATFRSIEAGMFVQPSHNVDGCCRGEHFQISPEFVGE